MAGIISSIVFPCHLPPSLSLALCFVTLPLRTKHALFQLHPQVYGVEACRATILSEVQAVFGSYGISVNPRHLALIADFMTFQGGYRACNRLGINSSPSPFLKMSFETATVFLMDATLQKHSDYLESPSARIVMGRIVEMGTGSFDLLQNIDTMIAAQG